jgi:hypothetical protein
LDSIQSGATKRVQAPTKRKDITPVAQEPDFLENEDEPEVTLPEGYDEMDFDDRKKAEQVDESAENTVSTDAAESSVAEAEKPDESAEEEPVTEEAKS